MNGGLDIGDDLSPGMRLAMAGMALACLGVGVEMLRGVITSSPALGRKVVALAAGELGAPDAGPWLFPVNQPTPEEIASCPHA